jgi:hypothetical protein
MQRRLDGSENRGIAQEELRIADCRSRIKYVACVPRESGSLLRGNSEIDDARRKSAIRNSSQFFFLIEPRGSAISERA